MAPLATAQNGEELASPKPGDWPVNGRTFDGQRFSPLQQITPGNVDDLRLAWTRPLPWEGSVQITPIAYNGVMYVNMPTGILALEGTTGNTIWEYQPELREGAGVTMRGGVVVYDGKVYQSRTDGVVVALDAETGEELWATPVTNIETGESFSAGPIFADSKIIVGPAGGDAGGNPGTIQALDAETGEISWVFNVIPGPDDPEAFSTWEPKPTGGPGYGGGAAWSPGVYDEQTRTVLWGTGQPTPWDRYDLRQGSADLYTNSYVALDVDTGDIKWHYQVVKADEWDLDQHATPMVADVEVNGTPTRVAVLTTTTGFLITLNMETGAFISGHSVAPEHTIHTGFEADGTPIIDDSMRYETSGDQRMVCPFRWVNYELGSYSPDTGLLYRPSSNECWNLIVNALPEDWQPGQQAYNFDGPWEYDRNDFVGALSAINPATGEIVWQYEHGYAQRSGAVSTAGGLVFQSFPDRTLRAFDAKTGDVLWEQLVSSTTSGNPISYEAAGVQYVAVPLGGTGGAHMEGLPDVVAGPPAMFVFALPQNETQAQK